MTLSLNAKHRNASSRRQELLIVMIKGIKGSSVHRIGSYAIDQAVKKGVEKKNNEKMGGRSWTEYQLRGKKVVSQTLIKMSVNPAFFPVIEVKAIVLFHSQSFSRLRILEFEGEMFNEPNQSSIHQSVVSFPSFIYSFCEETFGTS